VSAQPTVTREAFRFTPGRAGGTAPVRIDSPVPGVAALQSFAKAANGNKITKRLYRCPNGWSLGARRGGYLHLADADTWEIFVLDPRGIVCGDPAGFVTDDMLARAVARLAAWFE
jgi:hypothetical protein